MYFIHNFNFNYLHFRKKTLKIYSYILLYAEALSLTIGSPNKSIYLWRIQTHLGFITLPPFHTSQNDIVLGG